VGWLRQEWDDRLVAQAAAEHGVAVAALSDYRLSAQGLGALLLGYTGLEQGPIMAGGRRLAAASRQADR
jgi:DNA-binding transcriptional MocR family regulator